MALKLVDPYSVSDHAARRLAAKLALAGATVRGSHAPSVSANWVPWCDEPVEVVRRVRSSHGQIENGVRKDRRALEVSMRVPCRKCARCMKFRRLRWRQRMINELLMADDAGRRSWMVTLTFDPLHLAGVRSEAVKFVRGGKPDIEALEMAAYGHVQKWLKRVRKQSRARFRYVAVCEFGDLNGRIHFHLLLHEVHGLVLYQHLKRTWRSRVAEAHLVDCSGERGVLGAASYVSKYLTKALQRPRASASYGWPSEKVEARVPRF